MNCCAMQGYIRTLDLRATRSSFSQWNAGIHHVQVATSAQLVYNATTTIEISNDVAHILLIIQHQKAGIIDICSTGSYMVTHQSSKCFFPSFLSIILGPISLYIYIIHVIPSLAVFFTIFGGAYNFGPQVSQPQPSWWVPSQWALPFQHLLWTLLLPQVVWRQAGKNHSGQWGFLLLFFLGGGRSVSEHDKCRSLCCPKGTCFVSNAGNWQTVWGPFGSFWRILPIFQVEGGQFGSKSFDYCWNAPFGKKHSCNHENT